jgi:fatty acid desaturase
VLATPPLSESDVSGAGDREEALRRLVRRRRLRHLAGALAILNTFIVGVWIASGSSYFWPAWVMLGSAIALAIKALPRPARAHGHLLGDYP